MAGVKISALPTTGTAAAADEAPTNTLGGAPTVKRTLAQLVIGGLLGVGPFVLGGNLGLGANYISRTGTAAGLSLDASNNATLSGTLAVGTVTVGATSHYSLTANGTSNRYIGLLAETGSYAGALVMQAGGGSAGYGGSLTLYGHSHATNAGDIVAGVSASSGGSFRVENQAIGAGSTVFEVVGSSGNTTLSGTLTVSGTGPHAIGGATSVQHGIRLIPSISPGSGAAVGVHIGPTMTANTNGVELASLGLGLSVDSSTFATQTYTGLTAAMVTVVGAGMVKTGTGTIDNAASIRISSAPTIATNNYALWVDAGTVRIDDTAVITEIVGPSVGALKITEGARIGADSTNNLLDDASNGAGSATLYIGNASINVTSDERVKSDIRPIADGLGILNALLPIEFDQDEERPFGNVRHYMGFGARHSHKVAPWAVHTQGDTGLPWKMRQEFLMAPTVRAVQQLDERVKQLEARLN